MFSEEYYPLPDNILDQKNLYMIFNIKESRRRETPTLSTDADSRTDTMGDFELWLTFNLV